jgi:hypothetical protein
MQSHLFGHLVNPSIAAAVERAKDECLTEGTANRTTSRAHQEELTESDQLELIEAFGEMFGQRIRTLYSQKELRDWIRLAANRIVWLLGEKLASEESNKILVGQ